MYRSVSGAGNASMSIDDFYKLLAAQLKYQDADNPMDTSEMMAQMVQTQMIETINQMNQMSVISYAAGMIGKEATIALIDEKTQRATGEVTTGVITGISLFDQTPMVFVDGKRYYLSQVTILGNTGVTTPEEENDKPPEVGGETKPPEGGDVSGPPEDGNVTEPPEGGDISKPPEDGSVAEPPENGDDTRPPEAGGGTEAPGSGDGEASSGSMP